MCNSVVLLTGSSGFLGNYIKKHLDYSKIQYYTIGRSKNDIICDLKNSVPEITGRCNIVIHAAGKAHNIPKSLQEENDFFDVNVLGTLNLLKGLEVSIVKPQKFIFISSVSVYGLESGVNISENEPLLAKDPYGLSKINAESIISNWCHDRNIICTILRLPLVVGENPPGNLGTMIRGIERSFYFNIDNGTAKKSMVLASDVAQFILKAAEIGGTYNLTDGIHPTFNELSRSISNKIGKSFIPNLPLFVAKILASVGDLFGETFPINSIRLLKITSTLTFDDSKARKSFGWQPNSVSDGFKLIENV